MKEKMQQAKWITVTGHKEDVCPVFNRAFEARKAVQTATLYMTALGVYEAELNGKRISDFVLAPGWTVYQKRLQVQTYDVTDLIHPDNILNVTVGPGWYRSIMPGWATEDEKKHLRSLPCGLIALLELHYADGSEEQLVTDEQWCFSEGPIRFSEIYDGETYDARILLQERKPAGILDMSYDMLIPQEGEIIRETEQVTVKEIIRTPRGETVIDFGQEITGYVQFTLQASAGETVLFNHGEVLDADGNFYNENYRGAKAEVRYICKDGLQTWHPRLTFFGFRYIHLLQWPGEVHPDCFKGIVVHSDMKRTGWLESGHALMNRLFSNIVWGQRGNFLDVPTDCPQRDERLGWTGDAQVFIKAASYFYHTERFFRKWLHDMAAAQHEDGRLTHVVPDLAPSETCSAAWGDAGTICPWQIYQTYGDLSVLADQFACMKKWVDYITAHTAAEGLWTGQEHFGDWVGLDAPSGSYKGSSREDFIASAYYARSTELLIKAGRLLKQDMSVYEALYHKIRSTFLTAYPECKTQTEYAVAIHFRLADDLQHAADLLAAMVRADGTQLRTGFVGTPYILHALCDFGHADVAWDLMLRENYPGWLYPVTQGATTIWEHWDGIREDGTFWSKDMNSFNHYAYGAVADWVFEKAVGILHDEEHPGFSQLIWQPHPDQRVGWLGASLETKYGTINAKWTYIRNQIRYELDTPVDAVVRLKDRVIPVLPGKYVFWE